MTTQEQMLGRIREALSDLKDRKPEIPPPPTVWPVTGMARDDMAAHFKTNLEAVRGEAVFCGDVGQAAGKIAELFTELGVKKIAVLDRPLSREVAGKLEKIEAVFAPDDPPGALPEFMATLDAALVSPEYLLADTGSCVFDAPVAFDRLATYIAPVSIVVAERSQLRENMPAAWEEIKPRVSEAEAGEFVIVTGPSRTADIEKILILGVHGPRRLVVFLID